MITKKLRYAFGIAVILGTLSWLAYSGYEEGKAYYVTVEELNGMGERAFQRKLKVAGDVVEGSIQKKGADLQFELSQNELKLPVHYIGTDPVPDTFKGGIQAVVEGRLARNSVFEARKIQAKCTSKYEAEFEP